MTRALAAVAAGITAMALPIAAHASGFATARFGGEHGTPVDANPTALYYNPASLAETSGFQALIEYDLGLRSATYTHARAATDVAEPAGAAGANDGKASLFDVGGAPFIGASLKIQDLAIGAALFVPFGGHEAWDQNPRFAGNEKYPGAVDGTQRWYSIDGDITSLYFSLGAAYKFPRTGLSLGVSGNLIRTTISSVRARTATRDDDVRSETRATLDVSGFQGSFGAGVLWEAMARTLFFGASYQARPNVAGGMRLNGTLDLHPLEAGATDAQAQVSLTQDLPDIVRWGARWAPADRWELRLSGSWERWSNFTDQCIGPKGEPCAVDVATGRTTAGNPTQDLARGWRDGFGVRGGGSYWVRPDLELVLGAGYASDAVPGDRLEPDLSDFEQITVSAGAQLDVTKHLRFGLGYTNFFCLPRSVSGSASAAYPVVSSARQPDAGGDYTQVVGVFNISVALQL